jgi:hypothetical protein
MGFKTIRADTQDNGIIFLRVFMRITKSAGLNGAAGCVILGIKVDYNVFALKVFKADCLTVTGV